MKTTKISFDQPQFCAILACLICSQEEFLSQIRNRFTDGEIDKSTHTSIVGDFQQLVDILTSHTDPEFGERWMQN